MASVGSSHGLLTVLATGSSVAAAAGASAGTATASAVGRRTAAPAAASAGTATPSAVGGTTAAAAGVSAGTSFSPLLRITEDGNRRILETGGDYRSGRSGETRLNSRHHRSLY